MKRIFAFTLFVCLGCLLGCGGSPTTTASNAVGSPDTSTAGAHVRPIGSRSPYIPAPPLPQPVIPPSQPQQPQTYDMLAWMTMSPDLAADNHMSGTANPVYTSVLSDKFFWTKTGQGYPWDIQLYDDNYVYLWVTELNWHNASTFKMFKSEKTGDYNMPFVPRHAQAGFPGSTILVADSRYEIHSSCSNYVAKTLGHVMNSVWGPYNETLGGQLPDNLQTLVISYQYSCDSNYEHCGDRELFHLAQPYGLVKWEHSKLQENGQYGPADNFTIFDKVVAGQVTPSTVCF